MMNRLLLVLLLISTLTNAQSIQEALIVKHDGSELKVNHLEINQDNQKIYYDNDFEEQVAINFDEIKMVKEKHGTYWLSGMLGGLGGSLLLSAVTAPEDGEWWYGAGPKILIGAGVGTLVGYMFPKYKEIDFKNETALSFSGNGLMYSF